MKNLIAYIKFMYQLRKFKWLTNHLYKKEVKGK